jgi:hypothetical protein
LSQVSLRARITIDDPSKIGKYTCMAQDAAGNSGSAILTMQEGRGYYPQPGFPRVAPGRKFIKRVFVFINEILCGFFSIWCWWIFTYCCT